MSFLLTKRASSVQILVMISLTIALSIILRFHIFMTFSYLLFQFRLLDGMVIYYLHLKKQGQILLFTLVKQLCYRVQLLISELKRLVFCI